MSPSHRPKLQRVTLFSMLLLLAAGAIAFGLLMQQQQQQRHNTILSKLAAELSSSARLMADQAISYQEREATSGTETDFYQEVMRHMSTFDRIAGSFMRLSFPPDVTGLNDTLNPDLPAPLLIAIDRLELTWLDYRQGLLEALGQDFNAPRLRQAADYVIANQSTLDEASRHFSVEVQQQVSQKNEHAERINDQAIIALLLCALVILWLLFRMRHPSGRTGQGNDE